MIETLLPFFAALFVFLVVPGPDMAYVAACGAAHGKRGAFFATVGVISGGTIWVLATVALVAGATAIDPRMLQVIQGFGCLYLMYMAFTTIRHRVTDTESVTAPRESSLVLRGFVTNLSNPKCLVFFTTFLPQFVPDTASSPALYVLMLGAILLLSAFFADMLCGLTGSMLNGLNRVAFWGRSWSQLIISALFAGISVIFAHQIIYDE